MLHVREEFLIAETATTVQLIHATDLSPEEWEAYHKMRLAVRERYFPAAAAEAPVRSTDSFRERVLSSLATLNGVEYVLADPRTSKMRGWMRFFPQGDHLSVHSDFEADRFPEGFVRLVERGIQAEMAKYRLRKGIAFTEDLRQIEAYKRMVYQKMIPFHQLAVECTQVNASHLEKWRDQLSKAQEPLSLELAVNYPEEVIEDYISLQRQLLDDLPLGGQTVTQAQFSPADIKKYKEVHERNAQVTLTLFLKNGLGKRIGLSEVTAGRESGTALQGMTGLLPPYRGKGLGKALKAAMFTYLQRELPNLKRITTTTSAHNAGMLSINQSMGFEIQRESAQFTFDLRQMREAIRDHRGKPT